MVGTVHDLQKSLLAQARNAASNSYSPHSKYPVGAALLCDDGTIVTGCNVENRSIGLTICAERTALVKAISAGHNRFKAMAVVCLRSAGWPCGNCRQFMLELAPDLEIITQTEDGQLVSEKLSQLLPG